MSKILMVVDVQKAMVTGEYAVPKAEEFLAKWGARIDQARAAGEGVLFVQNDGEEPWDDAPGHPGWELFFEPVEGERTVRKTTLNVFESNPDLAEELKGMGVTELELIGLQSELCLFESSKGALANGFKVSVPVGMHATYDSDEAKAQDISVKIQLELETLGVASP